MTNRGLSEKSRLVLSLIAEGRGYDHIVNTHADISFFEEDVFNLLAQFARRGVTGVDDFVGTFSDIGQRLAFGSDSVSQIRILLGKRMAAARFFEALDQQIVVRIQKQNAIRKLKENVI